MHFPSFPTCLAAAALLRLCLVGYGVWHDSQYSLRFTDIDYDVYNGASRAITQGLSPYHRATYRYTPLLALLMLPNIYCHEVFGKLLFTLSDLLVAILLYRILQLRQVTKTDAKKYACIWLFHPISFTISTRGNADTIICALVLWSLYLILTHRVVASAIIYGLAVHFKIYPIVYALAFLVFLNNEYGNEVSSHMENVSRKSTKSPVFSCRALFTTHRIVFTLTSASVFLILTGVFYYLYGYTFLFETYLYHLSRTDNRHNFSVYFYSLYLDYNTPRGLVTGLLAFLPQMASLVAVSLSKGRDIVFSTFLLTMIFVAFNKVCTAQYFAWYTSLLPLVLPTTHLSTFSLVSLHLVWFMAELHWLYWANQLENEGVNTFFQIWIAGLIFFSVNISVIVTFLLTYTSPRRVLLLSHDKARTPQHALKSL